MVLLLNHTRKASENFMYTFKWIFLLTEICKITLEIIEISLKIKKFVLFFFGFLQKS